MTGDPRRWAAEIGVWGVVRVPDSQPWGEAEPRPVDETLRELERVIMYEGPQTIAAFILEPVVGTNGILIPPDGYLQGVREICDRHGIWLIADEVMSGFGRTGRWWAVDHWDVVPDMITMAKGLTAVVPAARRRGHAPLDRRDVPRQGLLRRTDLQLAPDGLRNGPGHDRRVRGGRPDRARRANGRGPGRAPPAHAGEAPVCRRRARRSACSE